MNPLPANENSTSRGARIASYAFTDISAGFFEKAKERFKQWRNVLNFQTFNIEHDPQEQGFPEGVSTISLLQAMLFMLPPIYEELSGMHDVSFSQEAD